MRTLSRLAIAFAFVPCAGAQSFNVDLDVQAGVPGTSHHGAANQGGTWNAVDTPGPSALVRLDGSASPVTLAAAGTGAPIAIASGGGQRGRLMRDALSIDAVSSWRFEGLASGTYEVTTFAWVPAAPPSGENMSVEVVGSPDGVQVTGDDWPCYTIGRSHALHRVHVTGGVLEVVVRTLGSVGAVNGFQLRLLDAPTEPCALSPLVPTVLPQLLFGEQAVVQGDEALVGFAWDGSTSFLYAYRRLAPGSWGLTQEIALPPDAAVSALARLAADGDTALLGSPLRDVGGFADVGGVFVLERIGGAWQTTGVLLHAGAEANDRFGRGVAIQGSRALVGAKSEGSGFFSADSAFVFERTGGGWVEAQTLLPNDPHLSSKFGVSLALDGDHALVGAPDYHLGSLSDAGAVYVFERTASGWVQVQQLLAETPTAEDSYGTALAASGGTAIIGGFQQTTQGRGFVELWERNGSTWQRVARLRPDDSHSDDHFGEAAAIDGDRAIVGAPRWSDDCGPHGSAYLLERGASGWSIVERIGSPSPGDAEFGSAVALDGETFVVTTHDHFSSAYAGTCRLHLGERLCPAVANSSGLPATLDATGDPSAAAGQLALAAVDLPPEQFGYFLVSMTEGFVMGPGSSAGNLCLAGAIGRFAGQVQGSGPAGRIAIEVDTSALPTTPTQPILAGQTWLFQAWFRDGATSNFSDALRVTFL